MTHQRTEAKNHFL